MKQSLFVSKKRRRFQTGEKQQCCGIRYSTVSNGEGKRRKEKKANEKTKRGSCSPKTNKTVLTL